MPNNTILKMDLMELQLFIKIQGFQLDNKKENLNPLCSIFDINL